MPLTLASIGNENSIKKIMGNDETKHHLANLGFIPGEPVTVISENNGNLILKIKDTRVALNKGMAGKIIIG